jgi:hypothetical protein
MSISSANPFSDVVAAGKNVIINGNFDWWRYTTSTSSLSSAQYAADRWKLQTQNGGTYSREISDLPPGSRYALRFQASATNAYMQMGQQIEFINCYHLQNQPVTISFWAKSLNANAGSTSLIVRTRSRAEVDSAATLFNTSNTDSTVTLSTTWTKFVVTRNLAATFGALSLEFALNSHVSGDGIIIGQVQMELGSQATMFTRAGGTAVSELALCQRYLPVLSDTWVEIFGYAVSTTIHQVFTTFPTQSRVSPTGIEYSNLSHFTLYTGDFSSGAPTAIVINTSSAFGASINITTTAGSPTSVAYRPGKVTINNSSGYIRFTGCELA